jgi:hypothetical protein
MKLTSTIVLLAALGAASATAAPTAQDDSFCFLPDGPCTQLDAAISSGRALLAARSASPAPDPNGDAAVEHFARALDHAAAPNARALTRRSASRFGYFCSWVGEGCGKVRRSAEAVAGALGGEALARRMADPACAGECAVAKRSIEGLQLVAREVLGSMPAQAGPVLEV